MELSCRQSIVLLGWTNLDHRISKSCGWLNRKSQSLTNIHTKLFPLPDNAKKKSFFSSSAKGFFKKFPYPRLNSHSNYIINTQLRLDTTSFTTGNCCSSFLSTADGTATPAQGIENYIYSALK